MSIKHYTEEHFNELEKALTYKDLFIIAEKVLKKMPPPVGQVCGPISTGGVGSIEGNLRQLEKAIVDLG